MRQGFRLNPMASGQRKCEWMARRLVLIASIGAALCGCASHAGKHSATADSRAILYEGIRPPANGAVHRIGDRQASLSGRDALRFWRRQLRIRAREAPNQSFKNPSPAELRRAIYAESRHYHFRVLSIRFLRPRQLAPEVIVETSDYLRLAQAVPRIMARIDPRSPAAYDAKGWAYEGFYFQADDERRVPFLSVSNFLRGPNGGGGEFARSERLYPYPHA
jgi:hypothetical protein